MDDPRRRLRSGQRLWRHGGGRTGATLPAAELCASWLSARPRQIDTLPSLCLTAGRTAGAIPATGPWRGGRVPVHAGDVGRHNAVDKVAGCIRRHNLPAADRILRATGRLTAGMAIGTATTGIPVQAPRSGFAAWGVDIARQLGQTPIGRMRGQRLVCLSGKDRPIRDADLSMVAEEGRRQRRKGAEE